MFEVETKLPVADAAAMRQRLAGAGATPLGARRQRDVFFAHPRRDFVARDEAFRVRGEAQAWELTFKGPRLEGQAKARVERNVRCLDDPTELLAELGYLPAATVEKHREMYRFAEVTLALDDVAGLGWYLEVEAMAADADEGQRRVAAAIAQLGLGHVVPERRAYVELLSA